MLNENIRKLRKLKGLSQEELAMKLNVVRQTISKWEKGLSVPDSDMLVVLADELDTSVSALLGESIQEESLNAGDLDRISEKLELVNLQLARRITMINSTIRYLLMTICVVVIIVFIMLVTMHSEYLNWDYSNQELAITGTLLHGFEFLFVRLAPFVFFASVIGIARTYKRR